MPDDILLSKAAIIQRSIVRAQEERAAAGDNFKTDFTRQDAAILNVQRACEAAIDLAMHLVAVNRLGLVKRSRDAFDLIEHAALIDQTMAESLKAMVGFRNVVVHAYQELDLDIALSVIDKELTNLQRVAECFARMGAED